MAKARRDIPGLADTGEVQRVLRYNRDCMFAVARKSKFNPEVPEAEAFIAMLPLTKLGLQLLAADALNTATPDTRFIAKPGQRPAGIYIWGLYAPGPLSGGVALFMDYIASPQYAGINLYSRPNTEVGRRFNESVGLVKGAQIGPFYAPQVWVFHRSPPAPLYDSYSPDAEENGISVTIARTLEDLSRVIAVRSAVYIAEQECPYEEEFDGNDLSATHLLAYVGNEPVGCLRVRYFADFAKIERLAIRAEYRKTRAAFQLVRAGFRLCQKKGYTRIYGHSQKRLVNFWSRFGFRVMENGKSFVFSDFDYVEIIADIARDPDCVTIGTDPYVIIRPRGRGRAPTCPTARWCCMTWCRGIPAAHPRTEIRSRRWAQDIEPPSPVALDPSGWRVQRHTRADDGFRARVSNSRGCALLQPLADPHPPAGRARGGHSREPLAGPLQVPLGAMSAAVSHAALFMRHSLPHAAIARAVPAVRTGRSARSPDPPPAASAPAGAPASPPPRRAPQHPGVSAHRAGIAPRPARPREAAARRAPLQSRLHREYAPCAARARRLGG